MPQEATTLVFSSVDMQTNRGSYFGKNGDQHNIKRNITEQEEVVVIGYGTQRKKDLTGSISTVDPKSVEQDANQ